MSTCVYPGCTKKAGYRWCEEHALVAKREAIKVWWKRKQLDKDDPPPPSTAAWRTCLKCGRKFWSEGPGNRICPKCAKSRSFDPPDIRARGYKPTVAEPSSEDYSE